MMLNLLRHAMHSPHDLLPLPAQAHCPHPPLIHATALIYTIQPKLAALM